MECVAGTAVGADGCGDRNAGGEPRTSGDRRADRVFRQYAGAAIGFIRYAASWGTAEAGKGAGSGGAAAPGHSIRAGGGTDPAGAEFVAQSDISGDVGLAERSRRPVRTSWAGGKADGVGAPGDGEVRSNAVAEGSGESHRRWTGVCHGAVRAPDGGALSGLLLQPAKGDGGR